MANFRRRRPRRARKTWCGNSGRPPQYWMHPLPPPEREALNEAEREGDAPTFPPPGEDS